MRGATIPYNPLISRQVFLLTRPMRGATIMDKIDWANAKISTHTPHAGRDWELGLL